jgi:hypothetical protein
MTSGFSIDFSIVRSPNRVLTPLKSASFEIRMSSFVPPSQIFVLGGLHVTVRVVPAADRLIVVISSSGDVDRHIIMISSYASVARNGWLQTTKFILTDK